MAASGRPGKRSRMAEDEDPLAALAAFGDTGPTYVPRKMRGKSDEAERRAKAARAAAGLDGSAKPRRAVPLRSAGASASASSSSSSAGARAPAAAPPTLPAAPVPDVKPGVVTLMDEKRAHIAAQGGSMTARERRKAEEADLLRQVLAMQKKALMSAKEQASGVAYDKPLRTDWKPPPALLSLPEDAVKALRSRVMVEAEGDDIPPPCPRFEDMRLPAPIMDWLAAKGIKKPTPIQAQGLPVALSGRDMVGVAMPGSGKTLTFTLPLVLAALQEELRMPLSGGDGPIGILMAPSRDLTTQTHSVVEALCEALAKGGYPRLRCMLCIGGMGIREQIEPLTRQGVHIVVATPGRLVDHLTKGRMNLALCRYVCLDEGDRMLDSARGFESELRDMFSFFDHQRQTAIFSATMPQKVREFAMGALVSPVTVNSGRAGMASMDIVQEAEYVPDEAKLLYLLECLQKTEPPVMVFSKRSREVDDITQYLLLKGVDVTSAHGGKSQPERHEAMRQFRDGTKDVLVATDVAAKGLDFENVQHVISFDMPDAIENYVHRIGRTGRAGKTGLATTFFNKNVPESLLLDLKHALKAAKQRVPPALLALDDPADAKELDEDGNLAECVYCQGFGHTISKCDKLQRDMKAWGSKFRDGLKDD